MKLNCGPTRIEKRYTKEKRKQDENLRLMNWHRHFCWLPTRMTKIEQQDATVTRSNPSGSIDVVVQTNDCRWLEFVNRRGVRSYRLLTATHSWRWQYNAIEYFQY